MLSKDVETGRGQAEIYEGRIGNHPASGSATLILPDRILPSIHAGQGTGVYGCQVKSYRKGGSLDTDGIGCIAVSGLFL